MQRKLEMVVLAVQLKSKINKNAASFDGCSIFNRKEITRFEIATSAAYTLREF